MKKVLGARRQREREVQRARRFGGGVQALDREREVVVRVRRVATEIFDGDADEYRARAEQYSLSDFRRVIGEAVLHVSADRKIRCRRDAAAMFYHFFARDLSVERSEEHTSELQSHSF